MWTTPDSSLSKRDIIKLAQQLSRKIQSKSFQNLIQSSENGLTLGNTMQPTQTRLSVEHPVNEIVTNEDALREFHKQEYQRYSNPYRPFRYIDAISGQTTVVAPLR